MTCPKVPKIRKIKFLIEAILTSCSWYLFKWRNWRIVSKLNHEQRITYAVYAVEQVIGIYERQYCGGYPGDDIPKKAIEAAKNYLKNPSKDNANAAKDAGNILQSEVMCVVWVAKAVTDAANTALYSDNRKTATDAAVNATYAAFRDAGFDVLDLDWRMIIYNRSQMIAQNKENAFSARVAAVANIQKRIIQYGSSLLESKGLND